MRLACEYKAQVRWILLVSASLLYVVLLGCGSSSTPTPPPAPLGHAYVVTPNVTYGYSISGSNGNLGVLGVSGGLPGVGKWITSNGQYVYVLNDNGLITAYKINSDFTLTQIAGSPFSGAPNGVAFLAVDPAGQYLFVPVPADSAVLPYTIDTASGTLTAGTETATPAAPVTATADPQGHFLYVPMGSAGTQLFQINGGALTSVKTIPPLASGNSEFVAFTPNGQFAYVADGVSGIAAYSVNQTTGDLTPVANTPFGTPKGPSNLVITPNGNFLYVASTAGLSSFSIKSDGTLSANGSLIPMNNIPIELAVDPTGAYLYVVGVNSNLISVIKIDQFGLLIQEFSVQVPSAPSSIVTTQ